MSINQLYTLRLRPMKQPCWIHVAELGRQRRPPTLLQAMCKGPPLPPCPLQRTPCPLQAMYKGLPLPPSSHVQRTPPAPFKPCAKDSPCPLQAMCKGLPLPPSSHMISTNKLTKKKEKRKKGFVTVWDVDHGSRNKKHYKVSCFAACGFQIRQSNTVQQSVTTPHQAATIV